MAAVRAGSGTPPSGDRPAPLLFLADRLFREDHLEPRWFAFDLLERTLATETERTWQLLRRAAREAGDWITVDSLAHPVRQGHRRRAVPLGRARAARLLSPSRWERRLVGSTIATMTHVDRRRGRDPGRRPPRALTLLGQLMGDAEPDVQKALAWAYRSLRGRRHRRDHRRPASTRRHRAVATADGHRAWVIRDTLSKLDPAVADELRDPPRRHPQAPGRAVDLARPPRPPPASAACPIPPRHPEPPLA